MLSQKDRWKAAVTKPSVIIIACIAMVCGIALYFVADYAEKADKAAETAKEFGKDNRQLILNTKNLIVAVARETKERRDEFCRAAEGGHAVEINELKRSYNFYENPPKEFAGLLSSPFVIADLRRDIRAAENDGDKFGVFVPSYCDQQGLGRKEPDLAMPKQPPEVKKLVVKQGKPDAKQETSKSK